MARLVALSTGFSKIHGALTTGEMEDSGECYVEQICVASKQEPMEPGLGSKEAQNHHAWTATMALDSVVVVVIFLAIKHL